MDLIGISRILICSACYQAMWCWPVPAKMKGKDKIEARIVRVLTPRTEPIVGRYFKDFALAVVVPEDPRITQDIVIPAGEEGRGPPWSNCVG